MGSFNRFFLFSIITILAIVTFSAKSSNKPEEIIKVHHEKYHLIWRSSLPNNFYYSTDDKTIQLFSGDLSKLEKSNSKRYQLFINENERIIFDAVCISMSDKHFKKAKFKLLAKLDSAGYLKQRPRECQLDIADLEQAESLSSYGGRAEFALFIAEYYREQDPAQANLIKGLFWAQGKTEFAESEGVNYLLKAGRAGKIDAYNFLGVLYKDGKLGNGDKVVEPDFLLAKKYYKLASEGGHKLANSNIGYMYYDGKLIAQNYDKALEYFLLGIADGRGESAGVLFDLLSKSGNKYHFEKVLEILNKPSYLIDAYSALREEKLSSTTDESMRIYHKVLAKDLSDSGLSEIETFEHFIKAHIGNHDFHKEFGFKFKETAYAKAYYDYKYKNILSSVFAEKLELESKNFSNPADELIYEIYFKIDKTDKHFDKIVARNWLGKKACKEAGVKLTSKPTLSTYRICYDGLIEQNAKGLSSLSYYIRQGTDGFIKDEIKAFKYKLMAAKKGHEDSYYSVGIAFDFGKGTNVDYSKAAYWYLKDLATKEPSAYNNMGLLYKHGQGVEKDLSKAVAMFELGERNGENYSTANLGVMYEEGLGVAQDTDKAIRLYKKANTKFGNKRLATLVELQQCNEAASTSLFNLKLNCASKAEFRKAIRKTAAEVEREDDKYWGDVYKTSKVLQGSDSLYIEYTSNNKFAFARYQFPSHMDTNTVVKVKNFVSQKYGNHHNSDGTPSVGKVEYIWNLEDGIELKVYRGWPETTTYLTFKHKLNKKSIDDAIAEAKRKKEAEKYKSQNNAF